MAPVETVRADDFAPQLCGLDESEQVSICEALDRVLNKGVVLAGEITISVADVDLVYLGLQLVLTSVEAARAKLENGRGAAGLTIDIGRERTGEPGRNSASRI